MWDVADYYE